MLRQLTRLAGFIQRKETGLKRKVQGWLPLAIAIKIGDQLRNALFRQRLRSTHNGALRIPATVAKGAHTNQSIGKPRQDLARKRILGKVQLGPPRTEGFAHRRRAIHKNLNN